MVDIFNNNHLYSVFFAPRGSFRMVNLGMQISNQYLNVHDNLIGIIGSAGSGKSMLVRGMFPGLDLTNDDNGVNVRPLPILEIDENRCFYSAHTYHIDMCFELAFTRGFLIAEAVTKAISLNKRVVIEHFELLYPILKRNADLLIGVGEQIIVTRPNIFGPLPDDIKDIVFKTINLRKMAHSAEDLCEIVLGDELSNIHNYGDIKSGFMLEFKEKPKITIKEIQEKVDNLIMSNLSISAIDDSHVCIGSINHPCTGPRIHLKSTGEIKNFKLHEEYIYDQNNSTYMLIGVVGSDVNRLPLNDINRISF
ncbi:MAG: alanine-tRNA synthetase second additional domain-containing protein [Oscillospiraceae bacterium]